MKSTGFSPVVTVSARWDISKVEPWLLKPYKEKIEAHLQDINENVVKIVKKVLRNLKKTPREHYYPLM